MTVQMALEVARCVLFMRDVVPIFEESKTIAHIITSDHR